MAKQIVKYVFSERLGRHEFVILPVITPQGNIKHLKIRPDVQPTTWVTCEWRRDKAGRMVALESVDLLTDRYAEGAMWLKDAYVAESWAKGYEHYERYLEACYTTKIETVDRETGQMVTKAVKLNRSRDDLHFPVRLLPRKVADLVAASQQRRASIEWSPDDAAEHPDEKARKALAELEKRRQVEAGTVVASVSRDGAKVSVTHEAAKKGK